MLSLGYSLSSEEFGPNDLVKLTVRAEEAGFAFAYISDHYLPWTSEQGHAPFAWSVLGGMAQATERIAIGTAVTCPLFRYHPALVAQMAATVACMAPGRFALGIGAGEFLNEHIYGEAFPTPDVRHDMLREAVDILRTLWQGGFHHYHGMYYDVQEACIFDLPPQPIPIYVAASGAKSARLAGELGDGLISTSPQHDTIEGFQDAGGNGPRFGQLTVCWANTEEEAKQTALRVWPNAGLMGEAPWDIRSTRLLDGLVQGVTMEQITKMVTCSPDPQVHVQAIRKFADAGFDHVFVHQVGQDQEGFFRFYEREVMPQVSHVAVGV